MPQSDHERLWDLTHRVTELEKDMAKMENLPTQVAILNNTVKGLNTTVRWLIGVLATFAFALLLAAVTFAINTLGGGTG